MKHALPLALLLAAPRLAFADALDDADDRAAVYRAGQPVQKVDSYVHVVPGGLSSDTYFPEVIGDGVDLVGGAQRKLCLLPTVMNTLSQPIRTPDSHLTVVRNDYDLERFFSSVSSIGVTVDTAAVSSQVNTRISVSNQLHLSTSDLAVIAHYGYTLNTVWYNGSYQLDPAYEALRHTDPMTFLARCGQAFLSNADNGVGMIVVYHLHQLHETDASDVEIQATLSAAYGLNHVDAKEDLTDRQKQIINAFSIASDCYVQGGGVQTCALVHNASQVEDTWHKLTDTFTDQDAVALRTGFITYASAFGDPALNQAPERLRLLALWNERESWVSNICNSAPYITSCTDAKAEMVRVKAKIDDPHATNIPEPAWFDGLAVFLEADLGHVIVHEDVNGGGAQLDLHFSANPKDENAYRPGIVYSLVSRNFGARASSATVDFQTPAHWVVDFFANEDGTGQVWSLGQTHGPENVPRGNACGLLNLWHCNDFNDQARAFRLRYIP